MVTSTAQRTFQATTQKLVRTRASRGLRMPRHSAVPLNSAAGRNPHPRRRAHPELAA
jgi:hypothetical protein